MSSGDGCTPLEACAIICAGLGQTGRWMRQWIALGSGSKSVHAVRCLAKGVEGVPMMDAGLKEPAEWL